MGLQDESSKKSDMRREEPNGFGGSASLRSKRTPKSFELDELGILFRIFSHFVAVNKVQNSVCLPVICRVDDTSELALSPSELFKFDSTKARTNFLKWLTF